ncbi:MAG: hypothetical protein ACLF0G_16065 [Candidatus Brocadiia bacterium]
MPAARKRHASRWLVLIAAILVWTSADGDRQRGRKPAPATPRTPSARLEARRARARATEAEPRR